MILSLRFSQSSLRSSGSSLPHNSGGTIHIDVLAVPCDDGCSLDLESATGVFWLLHRKVRREVGEGETKPISQNSNKWIVGQDMKYSAFHVCAPAIKR